MPAKAVFSSALKPWRHLGALGYWLFWLLAASGLYLYIRFDTSLAGAYASIGELEWWFGGVLRSLHRYAADAFVVVTLLHLIKELLDRHFRGFRAFSWISGVPLVWLLYASGLVGYWLVWDARAQYSFVTTLEWTGLAAQSAGAPLDRLFSLFVFLHVGLPLALLAGMWVHLQRLGQPDTAPTRVLAGGLVLALVVLAALRPAASAPRWDASLAALDVPLDWLYQFIHPLQHATSPAAVWTLVGGLSLALVALPYLSRAPRLVAARVDPANCNGCGRCVADCPFNAIELQEKAIVLPERCAGCGICAGACPSSTPFRSVKELVSGIDLPDLTVHALRERMVAALASSPGSLVFQCEHSKEPNPGAIPLRCLAMLPPAFIEYALRRGARVVKAIGCDGECAYRLGLELATERFAGRREPHLRATVRTQGNGHEYTFALR